MRSPRDSSRKRLIRPASAARAFASSTGKSAAPRSPTTRISSRSTEIVGGHLTYSQKLRNIARDPRVVISLEAPRAPGVFLAEHAVLQGRARVVTGGAYGLLDRLGKVYIGPQFVFPTDHGTAPEAGF